MKSYKDLDVYKLADIYAIEVHHLTIQFEIHQFENCSVLLQKYDVLGANYSHSCNT